MELFCRFPLQEPARPCAKGRRHPLLEDLPRLLFLYSLDCQKKIIPLHSSQFEYGFSAVVKSVKQRRLGAAMCCCRFATNRLGKYSMGSDSSLRVNPHLN